MDSSKSYIESGILELYVLGQTSLEENIEIETLAASNPVIKQELLKIELALEKYAAANAVEPNPIIKPFLMAMIDYSDRIQSGEQTSSPPILNQDSSTQDYAEWLNREDMIAPENFDNVYAKILNHSHESTTAIVWIKEMAPQEVHDNEFEKFLILEGTCTIIVEDDAYPLITGDYFQIPLFKTHAIKVTSTVPCKVILQRIAA